MRCFVSSLSALRSAIVSPQIGGLGGHVSHEFVEHAINDRRIMQAITIFKHMGERANGPLIMPAALLFQDPFTIEKKREAAQYGGARAYDH
ncbi:MAG: hypothetical protein AAGB02_03220 [Pseudomonadota bacterium]